MNGEALWAGLERLVKILGVLGATVLLLGLCATGLAFTYMVLKFGHRAGKMFIPFVKDILLTLKAEWTKSHPAIKFELLMQRVFVLIFAICFIAIVLHGAIPWHTSFKDEFLYSLLVSSFVIVFGFACVSFRIASRLP